MIPVLTIDISKYQPGVYLVRIHDRGAEVTAERAFGRIDQAIREAVSDLPDRFACFVEIRYHELSTGTLTQEDASARAEVLADRLIELTALQHAIMG